MIRRLWMSRIGLSLLACAAASPRAVAEPAAAAKPRVVLVSGEFEYESRLTLPAFKAYLEARYPLDCVYLERRTGEDLPGLEALERADLVVLFARRMTLPPAQLARVRAYVESGRPLVALRTSSHAFENWKEFDRDVLGGNYQGHHGAELAATVRLSPGAKDHPILKGVDAAFAAGSTLYRTSPLAAGAAPLLVGGVEGQPPEPVAWTHAHKGARVFYTSLGHRKDFESAPFRRLLVNAIFWALGRDAPETAPENPPYAVAPRDPPLGGLSPEEALSRMTLAPGFRASLFAAEPDVRQPVAMNWDDRGRMWVVEYLQYPHPAGLKAVAWDSYFRTKYDRVPEPPPKGPRGADRIKILEDADGDGRADSVKVFVDGLNIATGVAVGNGGVYIAQAPYLLYYSDRDADDVPDGPPEVLLEGFGMEDTHGIVNSLTWGPDGWLYGAQGSTSTAHIRGHTFQQGVWRYDPRTKAFEVFAEGGGNTWSFDWDAEGHLFCGTNSGAGVAAHLVQGGYYVKMFEKHGALSNPYAFGYFEHAEHKGEFKGGHITIGGLFYEADAYPASFRGKHIAGNTLANAVYWFDVERRGSTFTTKHGGELLTAHDERFRPVDLTLGPDGAVYVADWYDLRSTHNTTRDDTWDKTTGRIYRIDYVWERASARDQPGAEPGQRPPAPGRRGSGPEGPSHAGGPPPKIRLSALSSAELVKLLGHPNVWHRRMALRILGERRDAEVVPGLREAIFNAPDARLALESLWALHASGGFDMETARRLLAHPVPAVRAWTVRLVGDAGGMSPAITEALVALARSESHPDVRSQLAATVKRLSPNQGMSVLEGLVRRGEDADDPHIPLLVWWALESCVGEAKDSPPARGRLIDLLAAPEAWGSALARRHLVERLSRRLASTGSEADWAGCARILASAPDAEGADLVLRGMELGLAGRRLDRAPAPLAGPLDALWAKGPPSPALLRFAALAGHAGARRRALDAAQDAKAKAEDRAAMVRLLGQIGGPEERRGLLDLLGRNEPEAVAADVIGALGGFSDPAVADAVLARAPALSPALRARAYEILAGRRDWARKLVGALGPALRQEPLALVQKMLQLKDAELDAAVEKAWGRVRATAAEKEEKIRTLYGVIGPVVLLERPERGVDRAKGKAIFQKKCAVCHKLFGEGNTIGPDLTSANRGDVLWLIRNVVDPSASIRGEYMAHVVMLKDGRVLAGFVQDATPESFTILDAKGEKTAVARADVGETADAQTSLMPEGLLDDLDNRQMVDLFAYLILGGR